MIYLNTNFDSLIDQCSGKSVAIIGNSSSVSNYEVGNIIDTYDVVIRMNKFDCSGDYAKYVGSKSTIYATCLWNRVLHNASIMTQYPFKSVFCSLPDQPSKYMKQGEFDRNLKKSYKLGWKEHLQDTLVCPTVSYFDGLGDLIGARPSTGTLTLCWFLDHIPCSRLYCTGLSFGMQRDHYNNENYKGVGPAHKIHTPRNERYSVYNTLQHCDTDVLVDDQMGNILGNITDEDFHQYKEKLRTSPRKEF